MNTDHPIFDTDVYKFIYDLNVELEQFKLHVEVDMILLTTYNVYLMRIIRFQGSKQDVFYRYLSGNAEYNYIVDFVKEHVLVAIISSTSEFNS